MPRLGRLYGGGENQDLLEKALHQCRGPSDKARTVGLKAIHRCNTAMNFVFPEQRAECKARAIKKALRECNEGSRMRRRRSRSVSRTRTATRSGTRSASVAQFGNPRAVVPSVVNIASASTKMAVTAPVYVKRTPGRTPGRDGLIVTRVPTGKTRSRVGAQRN